MKKSLLALTLTLALVFALTTSAAAQEYSFVLNQEIVHVYWNSDGTVSVDYYFVFTNDPGAHVIDFVDVGMPNSYYDFGSITADVDGHSLNPSSDFQGDGPYGFSVDMGAYAIRPGDSGHLHVAVGRITHMLYNDTNDPQTYTSGKFSPAYWTTAHGATDLTVAFHLPADMPPGEPRYHNPEGGWPGNDAPQATYDNQNRVTYTWHSANASPSTLYTFGMSFPKTYVPSSAITQPSIWEQLGISSETLTSLAFFACCGLFFVGAPIMGAINERKRKMQYLPPKIAIEGHGIKRGLTAVESAILMEQPLDKIMTMILFGVVKKNAATVVTREPLKLQLVQPQPADLREYEKDFLKAFSDPNVLPKKGLQEMTVNLVKAVGDKMKGFSRKETIDYYKSIMERAWQQIEAAGTPEVKSQMYEEAMEWTMLDKDYDNRTRRVFTGPIFVPVWWGRYDPAYRPAVSGAPKVATVTPSTSGGRGVSVPGSAFAASVINGVQNFSSRVIGDVQSFTSGVTNRTNPVPKTSSGSSWKGGGGGGRSCACACACAGCACACAGGGR
jgi:hypothetical protein